MGGHVGHAAPVDDGGLVGTAAHAGAGHVHGHVAAADDADALAGKVGGLLVADGPEHLDGRDDPFGILAGKAQTVVAVGAKGEVDGIETVAQGAQVGDGALGLHLDATVQDPLDLAVEEDRKSVV